MKIQNLLAVLLVLVSVVGLIATKEHTLAWSIFFFGGLAWFVLIRILKD